MIVLISQIKINIELFPSDKEDSPFIFFLHGFTGSSKDWEEIIPQLNPNYNCAAVDLIGHGKSDSPENVELYKVNSLVQQLDKVFKHFTRDKFILVGYSMGGRAALSYAAKNPENLLGLILESSSAGIADEKLRQERILADEKIIKMIEEKTIVEFNDFWMNQDLFATLKSLQQEKLLKVKADKIKNNKTGLINSLRGFGSGVMPPMHEKINLIKCKTLLITGELDKKFTQTNSELVNLFPSAKHFVIKNAGHNTHFEKQDEFARVVNEFFEELKLK